MIDSVPDDIEDERPAAPEVNAAADRLAAAIDPPAPDPTVEQINEAVARPAALMGSQFVDKLIAAGVVTGLTRRIIIDAGVDQVVKIYTERFGDVGLLSVDFGDLAEPAGDTMPIRVTHDAEEIADHLAERIDGILVAGAKLPESRDDLAAVLAAMLEDLPTAETGTE